MTYHPIASISAHIYLGEKERVCVAGICEQKLCQNVSTLNTLLSLREVKYEPDATKVGAKSRFDYYPKKDERKNVTSFDAFEKYLILFLNCWTELLLPSCHT